MLGGFEVFDLRNTPKPLPPRPPHGRLIQRQQPGSPGCPQHEERVLNLIAPLRTTSLIFRPKDIGCSRLRKAA
jgi:hypothetical protein